MRNIILSLTATALLSCPAAPCQTTTEELLKPTPIVVKASFKERHPKLYKGFRRVRAFCIFVGPVVNVGANVATALGVLL